MTPKTTSTPKDDFQVLLALEIDIPKHIRIIVGAPSFIIDWGDDTLNKCESHDYIHPGKYQVRIWAENISKLKFISCSCIEANIIDCPELISIECANNPLQLLNIEDCDSVMILNCANCQLSKLSLTNLRSLRWLNCSSNNLKEIDLSGLANLVILDICNNLLEKLDLESCEKIVSVNLENNQLSVVALNDIFSNLDIQPPLSNAYINFMGNPGEISCDASILEVKSWKMGEITDPLNDHTDQQIQAFPKRKYLVGNSSATDSFLRLTLHVRGITDISLRASAQNILYVWGVTETSTSSSGHCTFVSNGQNDIKDVYIFATKLASLYIEDIPCTDIEIISPTLKALGLINTEVKRIDLTNVPDLQCLECTGSSLQELDLSPCQKLNGVTCNNNQLQILKANCLKDMQFLDCSVNQLKQLDVSGCTNLRTINIAHNKISELLIKECEGLRSIHCDDNSFRNFDVLFQQLPDKTYSFLPIKKDTSLLIAGNITFLDNPGTPSANRQLLKEKHWLDSHQELKVTSL